MTDQGDLWTAVKADYDSDGLITLTNIRDRSASSIDDTVGTAAALRVIELWPLYSEVAYDGANAQHVQVAEFGVIAMLWHQGGTSSTIAEVKWEHVFGTDGMISRVRRTGPRGHPEPKSNSGVTQKAESAPGGGNVRGWSDRESLPIGFLPSRRGVDSD